MNNKPNGWLIIGLMLFALSIAVNVWFAEDTMAQSGARYMLFHENQWYGDSIDVFPCELTPVDIYSIEADPDNRYDYMVVDFVDDSVYQIFVHGEMNYALKWRDFSFGSDGHPHPSGAYATTCEDFIPFTIDK